MKEAKAKEEIEAKDEKTNEETDQERIREERRKKFSFSPIIDRPDRCINIFVSEKDGTAGTATTTTIAPVEPTQKRELEEMIIKRNREVELQNEREAKRIKSDPLISETPKTSVPSDPTTPASGIHIEAASPPRLLSRQLNQISDILQMSLPQHPVQQSPRPPMQFHQQLTHHQPFRSFDHTRPQQWRNGRPDGRNFYPWG